MLPGKHTSYWVDSTPQPGYAPMPDGLSVDVAVVGAGITGLTAAYLLKQAGHTVALVESGRVAEGVSGYTTAKVTAGHKVIYAELARNFGEEGARTYAESNSAALELIARVVAAESVDCEFSRQANWVYADSESEVDTVRAEAEAAAAAGLRAHFTADVPLPWSPPAGYYLEDQAQFHPRRYFLHLASRVDGDGSSVHENTRVLGAHDGDPCRVETDRGELRAQHVILATHMPLLDRGLFFAKVHPFREYVVGLRVPRDEAVAGMFINAGSPSRSVRSTPFGDDVLLIVTGEKHKTGEEPETEARYERVIEWALSNWPSGTVEYRWSTQDNYSVDGVPYIGPLTRETGRLWTATGYNAWGMTNGTLAGMILSDRIQGRDNPWADLYESKRIKPVASATSFIKENVKDALHFVGDRLSTDSPGEVDALAAGEGAVVRLAGKPVAVSRNDDGSLNAVSATCTHMGCLVAWNAAERSWDCPCHGSRFDCRGGVLQGPATRDLQPEPVED